jgi:multisubunit Na+/H+ antiporter MnhG subunit
MNRTTRAWWRNPPNLALAVFLAIGGYFLWTEHEAHVIAALPWVLIAGCLVMHLFMHGSHSHGARGRRHDGSDQENEET